VLGPSTLNVGTISGGRAPNVIADEARSEIMFRLVGDPASTRAAVARIAAAFKIEAREVLFCPAVHLSPLLDLPTTVVAFTTDIPSFNGSWGQPFLIGPGSIHVAHTAEERIPKSELTSAVDIYSAWFANSSPPERRPHEHPSRHRRPRQNGVASLSNSLRSTASVSSPDSPAPTLPRFPRETLAGATTAIEFSTPAAALENLCRLATLGVRTVSGTTGWYDHLPQIRNSVETAGSALLYGPNFSVGRKSFFPDCRASCNPDFKASRIRSLGLGNPPLRKKRRPFRHPEKNSPKKSTPPGIPALSISRPTALAPTQVHTKSASTLPLTPSRCATRPRSREGYAHGALQAARGCQQKKGVYEFREIVSELGAAKVSV